MPLPAAQFDQILRDRRTTKTLAEQPLPVPAESTDWQSLLENAAWAPFHRPAHPSHRQDATLSGIMPWRFRYLQAASCRRLRDDLADRECGKIREMLASADLLIMATWLPNPPAQPLSGDTHLFEPTLENMEHLAAASAAVQNLLLAATARNIANYWSSGGVLRQPDVFAKLNVPETEILLGAIFLFPDVDESAAKTVFSKLHDQRSPFEQWACEVTVG